MRIEARPTQTKQFNYNSQDSTVKKSETVELDVFRNDEGQLGTDKVRLRNILLGPNMQNFYRDDEFKLNGNAEGDFVFQEGTRDYASSNAFAAAAHTVEVFDEKMQSLTGRSINWAFDDSQLGIAPHAGELIEQSFPNAFYYRPAGNLFFFDYDAPHATTTANSGEIVGHEAGHAILDALRPNLMQSFSFEAAAFHEAFGDVVSLLMSLEDESTVDQAVKQSGGDLSNPNLIAELGEEMGPAIGDTSVRNSRNNFKYVDPDTLPDPERGEHAGRDELMKESHSFARVWTGAFYELLDKMSDEYREQGLSPQEALRETGKEGWKLLVGQMENVTQGGFVSFEDLAQNLLSGDAQFNGGKRQEMIQQVFSDRQILRPLSLFDNGPELEKGPLEELSITLGDSFPEALRGVTVKTEHEKSIFASEQDEALKRVRLEKDIASLVKAGDVFIPEEGQTPKMTDFLKPDGHYYAAYLDRESNELKRVLMAG